MREGSPVSTCHMSCVTCYVTCHVTHVMCHMSYVTCNIFFIYFFCRLVKLVGGESVINGVYPSNYWHILLLDACPSIKGVLMKKIAVLGGSGIRGVSARISNYKWHSCEVTVVWSDHILEWPSDKLPNQSLQFLYIASFASVHWVLPKLVELKKYNINSFQKSP